jgi:hypothetical protein
MGLGHLVEDLDLVARASVDFQRNFDAAHRILDVDEGAGLAAVPWTVSG